MGEKIGAKGSGSGLGRFFGTEKRGPRSGGVYGHLKGMGNLVVSQGSLKDTFCPFETWLSPPKQRETTIYKAMFRCIMQGSLYFFRGELEGTLTDLFDLADIACRQ